MYQTILIVSAVILGVVLGMYALLVEAMLKKELGT